MKGNDQLIKVLNDLLAEELTAINQYMVHSEMCENWGYDRLHEDVEKRAFKEMKHAEDLIARILFLEGQPTVTKLDDIHIGKEVESQLRNDVELEYGAVKLYNEAIALAVKVADNGTRDLLTDILKDEEDHIDRIEGQLDQVKQMNIQNFLAQQIKENGK